MVQCCSSRPSTSTSLLYGSDVILLLFGCQDKSNVKQVGFGGRAAAKSGAMHVERALHLVSDTCSKGASHERTCNAPLSMECATAVL